MECEFCGEEISSSNALACPRCGSPLTRSKDGEPSPQSSQEISELIDLTDVSVEKSAVSAFEEDEASGLQPEEAPADMTDSYPDADALADASIPPGTAVTPAEIDIGARLTGGYKGPEGPSVAGAGFQTADDPFGLNIEPPAQPGGAPAAETRARRPAGSRSILLTAFLILLALAAIAAVVYFGFMRKGKIAPDGPRATVKEFCERVAEGDLTSLEDYAVAGAPLIDQAKTVLNPYDNEGVVTLKSFEGRTLSESGSSATFKITRFEVEVQADKGPMMFDVLEQAKPIALPTRIHLVKRDGKWLIDS